MTVRLTPNEIEYIARKIVKSLVAAEKIQVDEPEEVMAAIGQVITDELHLEDQLNEEVRDVLVEHTAEMSRSDITYNEMFKMVKRRLAKEKGLVL
jgi:hypothetical protein